MAVREFCDLFVIDDLFRPGEISMTYVEIDRGCDSRDSHKLATAVTEMVERRGCDSVYQGISEGRCAMQSKTRKSVARIVLIAGALCAELVLCGAAQAQSWTHPGIVVSRDQLNATRAAYQTRDPVIVDQVNKAMNSNYGSLTYTVQCP